MLCKNHLYNRQQALKQAIVGLLNTYVAQSTNEVIMYGLHDLIWHDNTDCE